MEVPKDTEKHLQQDDETTPNDVAMSSTSLNVEAFRRGSSPKNKDYVRGTSTICLKEEERQPCLVYSRVMGYFRPVQSWNIGKKQEYEDRLPFREFKEPKETSDGDQGLDNGKGNCECNQAVV